MANLCLTAMRAPVNNTTDNQEIDIIEVFDYNSPDVELLYMTLFMSYINT